MTGLLVSVRNAAEARAAVDGGADLVDVKEPLHGSLGAASLRTIEEVVEAVAGRVPTSAAFGELLELVKPIELPSQLPLQYAKLGLAHCRHGGDWHERWRAAFDRLPAETARVAVVYADWRNAASPEPLEIIDRGGEIGCRALLVDTFDKSRGDLFVYATLEDLSHWVEQAWAAEMLVVIAGSLSRETIGRVLPLKPDHIAVRNAACRGGRTGTVEAGLVAELSKILARNVQIRHATPDRDCKLDRRRGQARGA